MLDLSIFRWAELAIVFCNKNTETKVPIKQDSFFGPSELLPFNSRIRIKPKKLPSYKTSGR